MNIFQYAEAHPWWTLVYLVVIGFFVSSTTPLFLISKESKD